MVSSDLKPRRTFVVLTACTLAVLAALVCGLTLVLRTRLRREIEQREAQSIHDVAAMQIAQAEERLKSLRVPVTNADIFAAVLASSRLHGVMGVQLFDPSGKLGDSLPTVPVDATALNVWWPPNLAEPGARYYRNGRLEQIFGLPPEPNAEGERTPLLEVLVPLRHSDTDESLGVARYWIDGSEIEGEFRRLDESLAAQATLAFVPGALLVAILLAWSYRRLQHAHQQVLAQSADLARANQELDFAAKTGALGTISAHLIHGLKNPLAGLEGFVSDAAATPNGAGQGEAQKTALETARRLRAMVNEVVAVLRDETSGAAEYAVPLNEMLDAVQIRALPIAQHAGVTLEIPAPPAGALVARTANLASLVLANLLANAIEATRRGGEVRVDTRGTAESVEFLVRDSGPGLPTRIQESLFRPVVSTKPGGGGMGLAISARLARHARGDLTLEETSAEGTVFRLTVPAAPAQNPV